MLNLSKHKLDTDFIESGKPLEIDGGVINVRFVKSQAYKTALALHLTTTGYYSEVDKLTDEEKLEQISNASIVATVASWKGISFDGKTEAECTPENILELAKPEYSTIWSEIENVSNTESQLHSASVSPSKETPSHEATVATIEASAMRCSFSSSVKLSSSR